MKMFWKVGVPVKTGDAEKTSEPVPVSSESESMRFCETPVVVRRLFAEVKSARLAVRLVTLRSVVVAVPRMVRPVAPVPPPMVEEADALSDAKSAVPVKVGLAERTNVPQEPVVLPERIPASSEQVSISALRMSPASRSDALRVLDAYTLPVTFVRRTPAVVVARVSFVMVVVLCVDVPVK